jgi:hypothetical protein
MKHYVYALDTTKGDITAALSFPDKQTAKLVLHAAKGRHEAKYGSKCDEYEFKYICVDTHNKIRIPYTNPPRGGYIAGYNTAKIFDLIDFESVEPITKKLVSDSQNNRCDIVFMRYAMMPLDENEFECRTDLPSVHMVATGRGNRSEIPLEIVGETVFIDPADESAMVIIKNEHPIAVVDEAATEAIRANTAAMKEHTAVMKEHLQQPISVRDNGVAGDVLWASTISKIGEKKYVRWIKWKSGMGFMDIAKEENSDLVDQLQDCRAEKQAQKDLELEADTIRKQVQSVEKQTAKPHKRPS